MNDLKELEKLMKEHPIIIVVTLAAMAVGAILGAAERGGERTKDLYFYILHVIIFSKGEITCRIF